MAETAAHEKVIQQYLDEVAARLPKSEPGGHEMVLRELRDHVWELVSEQAEGRQPNLQDVYAALAQVDPPEKFAPAAEQSASAAAPNPRLTTLAVVCSGMQMLGLVGVGVGIPVLPGIGGFAAIAAFLLMRARADAQRWQLRLSALAAACGAGIIVLDIARVMG